MKPETRVAHVALEHQPLDVRVYLKECRTLARAGYDVHYIALGDVPAPRDGVRFHGVPKPRRGGRAGRLLGRLRGALRAARRVDARVYHLHEPNLIPLGVLLKLAGRKVVYDAHEDYPAVARGKMAARPVGGALRLAWYTVAERVAGTLFDAVVTATHNSARRFSPRRGGPVVVSNFPVLGAGAEGESHAGRPPVFAYVGGITRIRGVLDGVQALRLFPDDVPARLVLAGTFNTPELEREVLDAAPPGRLEARGWQTREQVAELLAGARAGIVLYHPVPHHLVSEPNKLFEYMEAGLPVIASDFPLFRGIVEPVGCGVLVNPRDPADIARAMRWILDHPAEAAEMGRRGRRAVERTYNWEPEGRKLVDLYARLAG